MKNNKLIILVVALLIAGLFAFRTTWAGAIRGTVVPANAAIRAWAVSATDTFRANVTQGSFQINAVKPGTYRIIIEANAPYKNMDKENTLVADTTITEAGEFRLIQ